MQKPSSHFLELFATVSTLESKVKLLEYRNERLRRENTALRMQLPERPHAKRLDGKERAKWGHVKGVVMNNANLSAPEIARRFNLDRYAVYAAAKRLGVKLPNA